MGNSGNARQESVKASQLIARKGKELMATIYSTPMSNSDNYNSDPILLDICYNSIISNAIFPEP